MADRFTVTPFAPADYLEAAAGRYPWPAEAEAAARLRAEHGPAFTARVDGAIAAVAGVTILWPGVGEAWLIVTPLGRRHPIFVTRAIGRGLARIIAAHRLRRVHADVVADFVAAGALVEALGFRLEGPLRSYGPAGEDFVRYALFPVLPDARWAEDGVQHVLRGRQEYIETEDGRLLPAIAGGYDGGATAFLIVGAIIAAAGTAVTAYSVYQAGEAQADAAKYNAKVAETEAVTVDQAAHAQAQAQRAQARRVLAANEAAYAGAGQAEAGSPLLVMADEAATAELNARMTEWGGQARATGIRSEIPLLRVQARRASQAGALNAGSTLLSGASGIANRASGFSTSRPATAANAGAWRVGEGGYW